MTDEPTTGGAGETPPVSGTPIGVPPAPQQGPTIAAPDYVWGDTGLLYAPGDPIPLDRARELGLVENRDEPTEHENRDAPVEPPVEVEQPAEVETTPDEQGTEVQPA